MHRIGNRRCCWAVIRWIGISLSSCAGGGNERGGSSGKHGRGAGVDEYRARFVDDASASLHTENQSKNDFFLHQQDLFAHEVQRSLCCEIKRGNDSIQSCGKWKSKSLVVRIECIRISFSVRIGIQQKELQATADQRLFLCLCFIGHNTTCFGSTSADEVCACGGPPGGGGNGNYFDV